MAKKAQKGKPAKKAVKKPIKKAVAKKSAPQKAKSVKKVVKKAVAKKIAPKKAASKKVIKPIKKKIVAKKVIKKVTPKKSAPKKVVKKIVKKIVKKAVKKSVKKIVAKKTSPKKVVKPIKKAVVKPTKVVAKPTKIITKSAKVAKPAKPIVKKATKVVEKEVKKIVVPVAKVSKPSPVVKKKAEYLDLDADGKRKSANDDLPMIVEYKTPSIRKPLGPTPVPHINTDKRTRYTDAELKEFKELILKKLEEAQKDFELLKSTLSHKDDHGTDDTSPTFKLLEDGSDVLSKEETSHLASRQEKFIQNLQNALIRIENKTYGICRVTGKLISKERLRSVPHATLAIEAKLNQHN